MSVQAFRPELAVEPLNESVVGRLSRAGEVQGDRIGISPEIKVAGDEFAAIINPDRLGTAHLAADPFLRLDDILAAISEPSFCCRAEAKMGINDVQNAELVPKSQLIMNKIDRPDVIGAMAF